MPLSVEHSNRRRCIDVVVVRTCTYHPVACGRTGRDQLYSIVYGC